MIARIIKILFLLCLVAYIISPIDLIPDIIPIVGWIDDIVVGIILQI